MNEYEQILDILEVFEVEGEQRRKEIAEYIYQIFKSEEHDG